MSTVINLCQYLQTDYYQTVENSKLYQEVIAQPPTWANEALQLWDAEQFDKLKPFMTHHAWCDSGSLNVFQVVGTTHHAYEGMSWLDFLKQGSQMGANLMRYDQNPNHYHNTTQKLPRMSFKTMDGLHWYVDRGKHRTTIARFAFHYQQKTHLHGLRLDDYRFDHALCDAYYRLMTLLQERDLIRKGMSVFAHSIPTTNRHATGYGWQVATFKSKVIFSRYGYTSQQLDSAESINALIRELSANTLSRWFKHWQYI